MACMPCACDEARALVQDHPHLKNSRRVESPSGVFCTRSELLAIYSPRRLFVERVPIPGFFVELATDVFVGQAFFVECYFK